MPLLLLLSHLLLGACAPSGVAVPVSRLEVPSDVALQDAVLGQTALLAVAVTNTGTATAVVRGEVDAPFLLPDRSVTLAPGATGRLLVAFRPEAYEDAAGELRLTTDRESRVVTLAASVTTDADQDGHEARDAGGDDCDDTDPAVHPDASETCNGVDDDCDDDVDVDSVDPGTWFPDEDGDGYGLTDGAVTACEAPSGHADRDGDCDDTDPDVNPAAVESWYDGIDQDCDGGSDYDRDGDGHDAEAYGGDDCDDDAPSTHPGATDVGDGLDQDCDGLVDEDLLVRGDLLVSEVLRAPVATAEADGQYVELYNASGRSLPVVGFEIASAAGTVLLPDHVLEPGDALLLCGSTDGDANGGLACVAALPGLLDGADGVAITAGIPLDEVDWTGFEETAGAAWELSADAFDPDVNDQFEAWCTSSTDLGNGDFGTPGVVDAPCSP